MLNLEELFANEFDFLLKQDAMKKERLDGHSY
jgi:hypothetical protein